MRPGDHEADCQGTALRSQPCTAQAAYLSPRSHLGSSPGALVEEAPAKIFLRLQQGPQEAPVTE